VPGIWAVKNCEENSKVKNRYFIAYTLYFIYLTYISLKISNIIFLKS